MKLGMIFCFIWCEMLQGEFSRFFGFK